MPASTASSISSSNTPLCAYVSHDLVYSSLLCVQRFNEFVPSYEVEAPQPPRQRTKPSPAHALQFTRPENGTQ